MKNKVLNKGVVLGIAVLFILISTIQIVVGDEVFDTIINKPNVINISLEDSPEPIDGIYFMRDLGGIYPGDHEGALNKSVPQEINYIKCGAWIFFVMNGSEDQTGNYTISSIYYHMWWHEPGIMHGNMYIASYNTSRGQRPEDYNDSITINTDNFKSEVGNYRLIQDVLYPNPETAVVHEANNFSCVFAGFGPNVTSTPNQLSFVYINLPDNETLLNNDTDADYLNDYEELFIYATHPYIADTDGDGLFDGQEIQQGSDPNDYTDGGAKPRFLTI
jgi:hypothetical protein